MNLRISLLLIFFLTFYSQAKDSDCQFTVRAESEQNNSNFISHNTNQLSRQSYALLDALAAKVSCKIIPQPIPFSRSLKMLEAGTLSVISGMSKTAEREKFSYFIGPYHNERIVVVGNNELKGIVTNLGQILKLNVPISVTQGAFYGAQWERALDTDPTLKTRIAYLAENQQKFSMLMSNRVAMSLEDERVVDELLGQDSFKKRLAKLFVLHENPVYFAFSKKAVSETQYKRLDQHWQQMVQSGEVKAIQDKIESPRVEKTPPSQVVQD